MNDGWWLIPWPMLSSWKTPGSTALCSSRLVTPILTKHPIGTKVYSFRDHPYKILVGEITEHVDSEFFNYRCRWFDPVLNQHYTESCFAVYLTRDEAKQAHKIICAILHKA